MDMDSTSWLTALGGTTGAERDSALVDLHGLLLRVARHEAYRRGPAARIGGSELDDLAHQAADDAMVSLLAKLGTFRGESRFTTWAYRFAVLEVASKLARHHWRRGAVSLDAEDWDRLPARFGDDPPTRTQHRDLVVAVRRAVADTLTDHQRRLFVAVVLDGVPLDAMAARSGSSRGAIYKAVFDARRKIRAYLTANGYLEEEPKDARPTDRPRSRSQSAPARTKRQYCGVVASGAAPGGA
ncbi:RNA polymerase sigma factor [Glycomyces sp. A-F 0318]|uniref:sigma-70 family RNA polymerase sigma factor n=1 Tax=Glycomyces amatae TaxID=2881355 RepID=UPI001E30C663|nr:RNA polymerase sigma factor [Glycomyces amatae]MCD0444198.1 RNA polymerase sigma factor [Glycomyces amatae]